MNKETFIEKLQEALVYEEKLILEDERFYRFMMKESDLSDERRKEIERLFTEVIEETKRHKDTLIKLKQEVQGSLKHEF